MTSKGYPKCQRCGYSYTGAGKAVFQFEAEDGTYIACEDCLAELGQVEAEEEKEAIMQSFKVKAN